MQATLPRLAIYRKATSGMMDRVTSTVDCRAQLRPGPRRPRPDRPAARGAARPAAAAARTSGWCSTALSIALMVRGQLGNAPWDVLHSGLAKHLPLTLGEALVIGELRGDAAVDPAARGARHRHHLNAIVIGVAADASCASSTSPDAMWLRGVLMVGGVVLCGLATAMYIGAQLGRGPRDGLMTGLARRTGLSLRLVRTLLEITVVAHRPAARRRRRRRHRPLRPRHRPPDPADAPRLDRGPAARSR